MTSLLLLEEAARVYRWPEPPPEPEPEPEPVPGVVLIDGRSTLTTQGGGYDTRSLAGITGVDIHYSATPYTTTVASIADYHVYNLGWPGIGYSYVADGQGRLWLCHDLNRRSYHNAAPSANTTRVGVCFIGDVGPTDAQERAMRWAIQDIGRQLGRSMSVRGHRDAPYATACPGPTWPAWRDEILP